MAPTVVILLWVALTTPRQAPAAGSTQAPAESVLARGKVVYQEQRCRTCHSIAGQGNRRWPLDGVGDRLTGDQIRKWIVAPREMDPKVRKQAYDKLPKGDLDALVTYLRRLGGASKVPGPEAP